jgi:cellulose synthase/poly-beta-1,6-N-acetylglucosamine synthase-like glycosyltransferase
MTTTNPDLQLSVIVPVHNGAAQLDSVLGALRSSDLPESSWELIVVDDGSADATAAIAARYATRVIRLDAPAHGPAFARNAGSAAAQAEFLAFIDGDVCVHPDTLRRLLEALVEDPAVDAVFGAYDTAPAAAGTVSQYRNLVHHYVHARRAGDADTFWAGCGAVRRRAFERAGGFDALRYPRPQIEDIALGYKLRARGGRILLRPDIQATHLKRWTLRTMVVSDVLDRGVPWARLLLERRTVGNGSLNVRPEERLLTAVTALGAAALVVAPFVGGPWLFGVAVAALATVVAANARLFAWFARVRGVGFAVRVIPLRVLYYLLNAVSLGIALTQHVTARAGSRGNHAVIATESSRAELSVRRTGT